MSDFRNAVEAGDVESVIAQLADDVEFHSPIRHGSYVGPDEVAPVIRAVGAVFEDLAYEHEYRSADGGLALQFRARIGDRQVQGCDFVELDATGRVQRLTVMVRPLTGAVALVEAVRRRLDAPAA